MTRASLALSFLMALSAPVATPQLAKTPSLHFATIDEGRSLLTKRDDFVARLSPFDRAARVQIDKDVTEREFLRFVAGSVRAWTAEERTVVESAWSSLKPKLDEMALPFPETVYFIKTSGAEEGGQEYTRGNSIVLPESALSPQRRPSLNATIAHELFHVLSRNAPELRDKLYAVIGFQPCGEIEFPPPLASRKLTDPDAPKNDHCILLNGDAGPVWAAQSSFRQRSATTRPKAGHFSGMYN